MYGVNGPNNNPAILLAVSLPNAEYRKEEKKKNNVSHDDVTGLH